MAVGLWAIVVAAVLAILYGLRKNTGRWSKLHLPPGPRGVPVLGSLTIFIVSKLPHNALADLAKEYGPLMFLRLGCTPCVVATSPEVLKEVLKNQDQAFASRPNSSTVDMLVYGGKDIAFSPYGEHWRQLRKIVTLELLTQRRINQFQHLREEETSEMVRAIYQDAEHDNGKAINLRPLLKALAFNFTTQICFTKRFFEYDRQGPPPKSRAANELNEINVSGPNFRRRLASIVVHNLALLPQEAREFTRIIEETLELMGVQLIGDFIPCLSFLDRFTNLKPRMIKCHKRFDEFISRILKDHRTHPKQDFMDVLLGLPGLNGKQYLDEDTIKALCLDILEAGTGSTSTALEWIMAELVRHPEVAAKLQSEQDTVVGKDRLVEEADLPKLPYLEAVVKEGFRLHPAGAFNIPHFSVQQTKVMGYDIPKSTMVFTNIWAMQRDPLVWANPMEFRPERFLDEPEIDVRGQHYQLLPFGSGRRGCPGTALGLTMVQYPLARLVQAFDWSPPKGMRPEEVDIEELWGLTLPRAHFLEAVATPRLPFHLY